MSDTCPRLRCASTTLSSIPAAAPARSVGDTARSRRPSPARRSHPTRGRPPGSICVYHSIPYPCTVDLSEEGIGHMPAGWTYQRRG
eukprot:7150386-Pyramimonas_sp.AAC.2